MKYFKITPLYLFLITIVLYSCEKDDICPEGTQTTSQLVIEFFDLSSPDDLKNVSQLLVYGLNDLNEAILLSGQTISNKSKVTVPLRTDSDITKLVFHMDYSIDDNDTPDDDTDDVVLGNPEVIEFSYTREDVYVSRACGYKNIFTNLLENHLADTDNWILNTSIEIETVENENTTHVKIFH